VHGAGEGEGEDEGQDGLYEVDLEERGLEGGELEAGKYAVCGCTCDEGLEDIGTDEGALGEDVVGCWGEEFVVEAGEGHGAVVRCWWIGWNLVSSSFAGRNSLRLRTHLMGAWWRTRETSV
jgi:hypothetical protein